MAEPKKSPKEKARELTEYDHKQIARTPQQGKFTVLSLQGGRTVLVNKQGQVVTPVAVDAKEKSDLRRIERDMNMKDPEQKPHNRILADTPKFGTISEEQTGRVANPTVVDNADRGTNSQE